jgi:hypothetical protein
MYATERYIPRNLAQVYERCAVMLFDRWDSMRGIAMPVQFQGRLRGAVQHLAWRQFTADESGKSLPRSRIVRMLANYLIAKRFDDDEAAATAAEFVEFCTGRAWILTDVGATETEPRYGFAHRTFLEYFAAEHLVRTEPTAARLWSVLRSRVLAGEWEVVGQIALQLLDRNVDGGVDEVLRLVLAEMPRDLRQRAKLNDFAARSLGYVHPSHDVVRSVVRAALNSTLETPVADRFHYWVGSNTFGDMEARDGALHTAMYDCSPGNLLIVRRTVTEVLRQSIEQGNEIGKFVACGLARHLDNADQQRVASWVRTRENLLTHYQDEVADWQDGWPCMRLPSYQWSVVRAAIARVGPRVMYLADAFLTGSALSQAELFFKEPELLKNDHNGADQLSSTLISAELPWFPGDRWWTDLRRHQSQGKINSRYSGMIQEPVYGKTKLTLACLLSLPYLEIRSDHNIKVGLGAVPKLFNQLIDGRQNKATTPEALRALETASLPNDAHAFLTAWVRREFNVLGPPTSAGPAG